MLGKMGMAHPAVDGYLIDDWYTDYHGMYGPSEIPVSVATACPKLERANMFFILFFAFKAIRTISTTRLHSSASVVLYDFNMAFAGRASSGRRVASRATRRRCGSSTQTGA